MYVQHIRLNIVACYSCLTVIVLQMTWVTIDPTPQMKPTIRVQINELADPGEFAMETEYEGILQLRLFEKTGILSQLEGAISNMTLADTSGNTDITT